MLYFEFQKLEIYQLSKALVKDILSSSFPSDEPSHDKVFDTHADDYNSWHGHKYKTGVLASSPVRKNGTGYLTYLIKL